MSNIRVVLADDHALVRAGFRSLLSNLGGVEVVGEAGNGLQALQLIGALHPEIALMDIAMPEMNGLETSQRVAQQYPETHVIILSMHANAEYARRAVRAGASGYLLKDSDAAELELALRAVSRGESYLTPAVSKHIVSDYARAVSETSPLEQLTARQREILTLLAEGYTRKEIAQKLQISVKTFDTYRVQLMEQVGIYDRAGLMRYAARLGLIFLENELEAGESGHLS